MIISFVRNDGMSALFSFLPGVFERKTGVKMERNSAKWYQGKQIVITAYVNS